MRKKLIQGICVLTSALVMSASVSYPIRAEDEILESEIICDILTENDDSPVLAEENWLAVATEVLTYYAKFSAGLEPLVTERNWRFYDVIPDKTINILDATYFLTIYATVAAGIPFEGYIPKRDGNYSPVTITTEPPVTTDTTEITTTETSETETTVNTTNSTVSSMTTTVSTSTTDTSNTTTSNSVLVSTTTTPYKTTTTSKSTTSTTTSTTVPSSTSTTVLITVSTRPPKAFGIDVSVYQGKVNWNKVAESGIDFAIIRAGYGKHANQKDRYFETNMNAAKELGINCGAYWFSYATTAEDAQKEADAFYEVIKNYKFEYPVFFDYETNDQFNLKPEESSKIINAFCERMESYGYYVSLCSYVGFFNYKIESEILDKYDTWIAHYDVEVPWYSRDYGIWQYSCTGKIAGIETDVDLNYSYRDYPKIIIENNLNGF
ncbi:MAG: hypothetical protein K2H01_01755 [Ruminococcus sp.]|nr:hypothetical protein [Ruminococcus sp.]